jgi:hypothetical protein
MTENSVAINGLLDLNIYSAYALGEESGSSSGRGDTFPRGFDISVGGEYALLPMLDLGASISHLPILPAKLSHRVHVESEYEAEIDDTLDAITAGDIDLPDPEFTTSYNNNTSFYAFRPFRFNTYVNYRPADSDLFVIRPNLGFSLLSVFDNAFCFNAGVEGQINILEVFSVALFTGYTERVWAHSLRLMLNLHVTEINFNISLRGTDILSSFSANGLGVSVGLRFGF